MTVWDGTGLPPAAAARISRAQQDGVATSFLGAGGQANLDALGFHAVGEVMGCIVEHIGFQGYGGCGFYGLNQGYGFNQNFSTVRSSSGSGFAGFAPYTNALYAGWDTAISRMMTEARALGADGVVGVRLEGKSLGQQNQEFMVLGTAVRSIGTQHLDTPFATTFGAHDIAKLMQAGWMPASIVIAISVAVRHDDYQTRMATSAWAGNMEVPGYTELMIHVRDDARSEFGRRASAVGADGAIVAADMKVRVHEIEVAENHRDHIGEATVIGTSIVRFADRGVPPPPLVMLSLRDKKKGQL